jgi:WD40 repeat protein
MALSGSFDASAIRWSLRRDVTEQVLRLHESAVNTVAFLDDGRAITAGADGKIGIWTAGNPAPDTTSQRFPSPPVSLWSRVSTAIAGNPRSTAAGLEKPRIQDEDERLAA